MRKTFVLVLTFAACLLVAAPALAKEPGDIPTSSDASINGPGLKGPIHMSWKGDCGIVYPCQNFLDYDNPLVNMASLTGLSGFSGGSVGSYIGSPPSASQLGPRYRFAVTVSTETKSETVIQDIYPYAGARGWIYTLPGQTIFGRPLRAGWLPAPYSLRSSLVDLGLPARSPVGAPASEPATASSPATPLLMGLILLAVLAIGGALMAARLSRRGLPRPA